MKICDLLKKGHVFSSLKGESKEEIINESIDSFKGDEDVKDVEAVRKAVLEREKIMSTGVGKSFAIPHAKTNAVK